MPAAEVPELQRAADRLRGVGALLPQLLRATPPRHAARPRDAATEAVTEALTEALTEDMTEAATEDMTEAATEAAVDVLAFVEARGALWRYYRADGPGRLERLTLSAREAARLVAEVRARPDAAAAQQLTRALVPDAALAAARDSRVLAIVADGALAGLPFAALPRGGRALAQARVLTYWPALRSSFATAPPLPRHGAVVLAATPGRGAAFDLAAARQEVAEVAARLGVAPRLGAAATVAALRSAAAAPLLHVAAHGGVAPSGAFVRLADGDVTATDIVAWGLAPEVVVLASCASGARPNGSMWGALGGAFLAAGSRAVVATLWSVEDAATAALMRHFYAADGARDPERALAAAQRQLVADGVPATQWAAFVVLAAPP